MKDSIREITQIPELTMGLDLGDKFSYYCIIDKSGQSVEEGRVKTQRRAMERFFKSQPKMRVVLETGTHSRWVQAIAKEQDTKKSWPIPDRFDASARTERNRTARLESFWDVWEEWIPSCCIRFSIEAKPLKRTWRW